MFYWRNTSEIRITEFTRHRPSLCLTHTHTYVTAEWDKGTGEVWCAQQHFGPPAVYKCAAFIPLPSLYYPPPRLHPFSLQLFTSTLIYDPTVSSSCPSPYAFVLAEGRQRRCRTVGFPYFMWLCFLADCLKDYTHRKALCHIIVTVCAVACLCRLVLRVHLSCLYITIVQGGKSDSQRDSTTQERVFWLLNTPLYLCVCVMGQIDGEMFARTGVWGQKKNKQVFFPPLSTTLLKIDRDPLFVHGWSFPEKHDERINNRGARAKCSTGMRACPKWRHSKDIWQNLYCANLSSSGKLEELKGRGGKKNNGETREKIHWN